MNSRDLNYFLKVRELKHFGKAAEACFVSQPALSMQIKKLEGFLGIKLIERTNKSVLVTPEGEVIAEHAEVILRNIEEMKSAAKSLKDPFSGVLKIGVFSTLAPYFLPKIMPKLSRSFPKIFFHLIEEQTQKLIELLKAGKIDAAFLVERVVDNNFQNYPLFSEDFFLALASSHPLACYESVNFDDIKTESLLLLDEGHCLRDQALAICEKNKIKENQNFRATSLETLRYMVASGVGVTLIPKLACLPTENLVYIPFYPDKPVRRIALYWRKSSSRERLFQRLTHTVTSVIKIL